MTPPFLRQIIGNRQAKAEVTFFVLGTIGFPRYKAPLVKLTLPSNPKSPLPNEKRLVADFNITWDLNRVAVKNRVFHDDIVYFADGF